MHNLARAREMRKGVGCCHIQLALKGDGRSDSEYDWLFCLDLDVGISWLVSGRDESSGHAIAET